jgi:hypothetical protein
MGKSWIATKSFRKGEILYKEISLVKDDTWPVWWKAAWNEFEVNTKEWNIVRIRSLLDHCPDNVYAPTSLPHMHHLKHYRLSAS